MKNPEKYKFRKSDNIGAGDAEEDQYLEYCFVDTGDIDILCNLKDPRRIIVGRTGAGKTALIDRIKNIEENVINIHPENLSLNFITNINIFSFLSKLDIKIDIFFKLLWRHVFVIELLKRKYKITPDNKEHVITSIIEKIKNKNRNIPKSRGEA